MDSGLAPLARPGMTPAYRRPHPEGPSQRVRAERGPMINSARASRRMGAATPISGLPEIGTYSAQVG